MKKTLILLLLATGAVAANAQDYLYHDEFPLGDVTLLDGPLKHAQDLNVQTLLQYDCDRLLAPYRKEAGLEPKAKPYPNWDGLDGHVAGHYLAAMAMNAARGNEECRRRMEYMIAELQVCADANAKNHPDWGKGYVGGMPDSERIWSNFKKGDFRVYSGAWAPFYNIHKMFAGLRDAYLYCGVELGDNAGMQAKKLFLGFCDWVIDLTAGLSDEQMERMMGNEHGGMNEVLADAYEMTADEKYLEAARRFSHRMLLTPMSQHVDNLDNLHANTQVPKAVGFARIAELGGDENYYEAASFFWDVVTGERSLAFGGNSRREHFPSKEACTDFIPATPSTCCGSRSTSTAAIRTPAMRTITNSPSSTISCPPSIPSTAAMCISPPPVRATTATIPPRTRQCGAAWERGWRITASMDSSSIRTRVTLSM